MTSFCYMTPSQTEELWAFWLGLAKHMLVLWKTFMFSYMWKTNVNIFCLIHCKSITNFLFCVLWTCLATPIKNDTANFNLMFHKRWKNQQKSKYFQKILSDTSEKKKKIFSNDKRCVVKNLPKTCYFKNMNC